MTGEHCKVLSPHHSPKVLRKKMHLVNLSPSPVPVKLPPLLCSSEEKVMFKTKNRVNCNQPKAYPPIKKIDPSSLPRHCVPIQFEIVDNICTKPKKSGGLSKLLPKYQMQQTERTSTTLLPPTSSIDHSTEFLRRKDLQKKPLHSIKKDMASSRALRLDTMVLAKGVTLLDSKEAEYTPLKHPSPVQSIKLKPVRSDVTVPWISADQFTAGPPPKVIPLSPRADYKFQ